MTKLRIESGLTIIEGASPPFLDRQISFDEMVDWADVLFEKALTE